MGKTVYPIKNEMQDIEELDYIIKMTEESIEEALDHVKNQQRWLLHYLRQKNSILNPNPDDQPE